MVVQRRARRAHGARGAQTSKETGHGTRAPKARRAGTYALCTPPRYHPTCARTATAALERLERGRGRGLGGNVREACGEVLEGGGEARVAAREILEPLELRAERLDRVGEARALLEHLGRYRGDTGEIHGRYSGDTP